MSLLFLSPCLSLPRGNVRHSGHTLRVLGGGPTNTQESIERRASHRGTGVEISPRNQKLYPLYITHNAAIFRGFIITPVLEKFYDTFIQKCKGNIMMGDPLGSALMATDNQLRLIVVAQGITLT